MYKKSSFNNQLHNNQLHNKQLHNKQLHNKQLHNKKLHNKHTVFPQHKFDTILKNNTFHPTFQLTPSIFYIPIRFSPTPQSQTMPFLPSVPFQYSHSTHHNNSSAQQSAPFTHNVQYTTTYK